MKQLAAILIAFSFVVVPSVAAQNPQDVVVLTVNGDPVYASDLTFLLQNLTAQIAQRGGEPPEREQVIQLAMHQAVSGKLLVQEARRQGIERSEANVDRMVSENERSVGGAAQLDSNLASAGLTREQLRRTLSDTDMVRRLVAGKLSPGQTVTDEEIQAYYNEHPENFKIAATVRARHILFNADLSLSEGELMAIKEKAEAARKRALAGEDFATLATELSEGPTASRGGDLGFFAKSQMVEPFASAAFSLQPGEISPVVHTRFGYHVIKVEERRPSGTRELEEVKDSLRTFLLDQKIAPIVDDLVNKLREGAEIVQVPPPGQASTQPQQ